MRLLADVEHRRVDLDARVDARQLVGVAPVGGRPLPVEEAGRREDEGARAERRQRRASPVRGDQRVEDRLRGPFVGGTGPARQDHDVGASQRVDPVRRVDREAVGRRHARVLGRGHLEVELRHARLGAVDAVDLAGHGHLEHVHRGERQDDDALHRLLRGHGRNLAHRGSPATRRGSGPCVTIVLMQRNELIDRYERGTGRGPRRPRRHHGVRARSPPGAGRMDRARGRPPPGRLRDQQLHPAPATPRRGRRHDRRVRRGRVGPAPRLRPADRAQPGRARRRASGDDTAAPHARRHPVRTGRQAHRERRLLGRRLAGDLRRPRPRSTPTRSDEPEKVGPDARPPLPCPRPPRPARPRRHHLDPQRQPTPPSWSGPAPAATGASPASSTAGLPSRRRAGRLLV